MMCPTMLSTLSPTTNYGPRRLIMLVGQPRSGTTWLGKIFDSHPDTLYRHEPDTARRLSMPLLPAVGDAERYREECERFVEDMPMMRSTKASTKLPLFPKSYYSPVRFLLFRAAVLAAKSAERFVRDLPVPAFADFDAIPGLPVVWKSIESIGRVGVFARLLPEARFIILVRHPCGFIASMLRGETSGSFVSSTPAAEDWEIFEMLIETAPARRRGLMLADVRKAHPMERMAWRWLLPVEKALEDIEGLDNCHVVRYEDICLDPTVVTRRLFEQARLPWSGQTEAFLAASTAADDDNYYSIFKNPVRSVNKWRQQLATADIERILSVIKASGAGALYAS